MVKEGYIQTEIGIIPEDWEVKELSEIGDFKNGINKCADDFGYGYPFVNLMDVFGRNIISVNSDFGLVNSNNSEKEIYNLKSGDVIFIRSSVKPSGVGKTVLVANDLNDTVYSGFLIRFRNNTLSRQFKRFCFDAEYFRYNIIAGSTVSANTNINQDTLKSLKLAFPSSLPEQEAIATALSDCDSWIESLEQLLVKKRLIKQGAMQELLTPKEDWEVKKLGDVLISVSSGTSNTQSDGQAFPIYGSTGIIGFKNYYDYEGGNIIVARVGANAGRVNIISGKYCVSDNTLLLIASNEIKVNFLFYFLVKANLNSLVFGSGQPLITGGQLKALELLVPSLSEQERIAGILSDMDAELEALEKQVSKAREIKQGMMQGMMQELLTGKVRLV